MQRSNPFKFGTGVFDSSCRFETSWLLTPWMLFACRATIATYAFFTIFFIIGWEGTGHEGLSLHDVRKSFSFFTVLTYWGLAFYFVVASIHTFSYAISGGTPLLEKFPRPLQALHSLYWTTISTYPFLVTIVYWGVIFPGSFDTRFELWSNISQHATNSVFALFEIIVTRCNPAPWIHLLFLVIILICYLGLAYVTYATKHYFVYSFLDFRPKLINAQGQNIGGIGSKEVVGYIFGIAVGIIVFFAVIKGATTLRKWITETKLGKMGKFAKRMSVVQDAELDERFWNKP